MSFYTGSLDLVSVLIKIHFPAWFVKIYILINSCCTSEIDSIAFSIEYLNLPLIRNSVAFSTYQL